MRGLKLTVLIIVLGTLCAQSVHFLYYKFFYPRESALDDYIDVQIQEAESLGELIREYELAVKAIEQYESKTEQADRPDYSARRSEEPYRSKQRLESAIRDWEKRDADYNRLWYQWTAGLLLFVGGAALIRFDASWPGMALIVAGFAEMIWWSSPTFSTIGSAKEFDKLLNAKILLTALTILLVSVSWYLSERLRQDSRD